MSPHCVACANVACMCGKKSNEQTVVSAGQSFTPRIFLGPMASTPVRHIRHYYDAFGACTAARTPAHLCTEVQVGLINIYTWYVFATLPHAAITLPVKYNSRLGAVERCSRHWDESRVFNTSVCVSLNPKRHPAGPSGREQETAAATKAPLALLQETSGAPRRVHVRPRMYRCPTPRGPLYVFSVTLYSATGWHRTKDDAVRRKIERNRQC